MKWPSTYEQLRLKMASSVSKLPAELSPQQRLEKALSVIMPILRQLKELALMKPFSDKHEEIRFFKNIKPWFIANKIYEIELYQLKVNLPIGTPETLAHHYEEEVEQIQRFFRRHIFYYQYYRADLEELDHLYFIRGMHTSYFSMHEFPELETDYHTALDFLFAQFIAKEQLQAYLVAQLQNLVNHSPQKSIKALSEIKWTGEVVNLVELAYGVWLTGQVNNGNVSVSEIVRWLETALQVNIGRPSKRWSEISSRTRNSPTKYLQRMQDAIRLRIDEELDISPRRRAARR